MGTTRESTYLHVVGGGPVVSGSLNGHDLGITYTRYDVESTSSTWTYCHKNIATVIHLPPSSISATQSYSITFATGSSKVVTDGIKGAVARGRLAKAELDLV